MIPLQSNPYLIRKAKLAELKTGNDFGELERLKFFRSDEPINHTGGQAYTLFICNKQQEVLYESFILKYDI